LVGSIPAAIAGYYLESIAEHALRNPLLIASFLAFFGILLWLADYSFSGKGKIKNIGYINGFLVGIGQALALFPGVSRSGATITVGLFAGLDRQAATRFSFLLSTPAVFGAFILSLKQFNLSIVDLPFLIAIVTSATFGLLSIKFLLQYINKHGFSIFAIYRLILAAIITILYFSR
jgi:undecaprenyl-diphosphatase